MIDWGSISPDDGLRRALDLPEFGRGISNFDDEIDEGMEGALRDGKSGFHAAYEHWGIVWFEDGAFREVVRRYGSNVDLVSASTLRELMDEVNERWGRG
jgi:hypothetical protein